MIKAQWMDSPMERTWSIIGNRWKLLILGYLMDGTLDFEALKAGIPYISYRVLIRELQEMEQLGLLTGKQSPGSPFACTFTLTELGRSLKPVIDSMLSWGVRYSLEAAANH